MPIDPWSSEEVDYSKVSSFGIEDFDSRGLPDPPPLFRRGIVFGQRDFQRILDSIGKEKKFAVLTGLMPSGKMHFGHKMVIDQVIYFQSLGGEAFLAIADLEAYATRDVPLETSKKVAISEYIKNYLALGLDPDTEFYSQSKRKEVLDLAFIMGKNITLSEANAIYGFTSSTSMAHMYSPLIQVGDILHVQLKEHGGPRPTLVPVGIDQDPHIRLTRDLAARNRMFNIQDDAIYVRGTEEEVNSRMDRLIGALNLKKMDYMENRRYRALYLKKRVGDLESRVADLESELGGYGFYPPSSTYHRHMHGLTGGKMSSSKPESAIFLTDPPKEAREKVMRCKTGGAVSVEEQRRDGGKPDICCVYELLLYHLVESDDELADIYGSCRGGERLCGYCKKDCADRLEEFLKDLDDKKRGIGEIDLNHS
jgi:tryptophanyl-tRNA synthetase